MRLKRLLIFGIFVCFSFEISNAQPRKSPKNIILMIGDGMGVSQVSAGMYAKGNNTSLSRIKHVGLVKTHAASSLITDSAAGATAMACGEKTHNGVLAMDTAMKPLPTILEMAHDAKMATGLVATATIQHATPAAFYSHQISRNDYEAITLGLLDGKVDLAIGGGRTLFEKREDNRNLILEMEDLGYTIYKSLRKAIREPQYPMLVLEEKGHLPPATKRTPFYLARAANFAIDQLTKNNDNGFFLMIESSQIDWGGHSTDGKYIITEMMDFDQTIGRVLDFAEKDGETLVIVTADHETGGFAIEDGNLQKPMLLETDFTTDFHTATMVPIFAYGPGSEAFMGIIDNTEIFHKMADSVVRLKKLKASNRKNAGR